MSEVRRMSRLLVLTSCVVFMAGLIVRANLMTSFEPEHGGVAPKWQNISVSSRSKRFIIFDGAGVVKLVLGFAVPTKLPFQPGTLFWFNNIQLQYVPPPIPIYWWSIFNSTTFPARQQRESSVTSVTSHQLLYHAIEALFERYKSPGMSCLLRSICEVATMEFDTSADGTYNVLHELLNVIFLPPRAAVGSKYYEARQAGQYGANCSALYSECAAQRFWLDQLAIHT